MAFVTLARQDTQIRTSDVYDDSIAPTEANFETNPLSIEDDLNNLRSQMHNFLNVQTGNWWDDLVTPTALSDTGAQRGINDLNSALHLVEKKRVLRDVHSLVDITVPNTQNYVVLGVGELPSQLTAAVGAVTTLGTVVAHNATFGAHTLDEVAGSNALNPKNLVAIFDGSTRDTIISGGNQVWGLLQSESNSDGHTINTTTQQVQISFVRVNATGDDLEACPVADIQNQVINYCFRERVRLEDLLETDFLKGAIVDTPGAATTTDRQDVYDNQGTTPVDLTTNATLDIEGVGLFWKIRDNLEADLFTITDNTGTNATTIAFGADVDVFDNNALDNDFANQLKVDTGSASPVHIGVTDGHVETSAGDLHLQAAAEMFLDDVNQTGSTWAQTDGIKLSETTAEWDAFETAFGEVSLLNAIVQADAADTTRQVARATVINATGSWAAGTNITSTGGTPPLDAALIDYSAMDFDVDLDIYLNGDLLWPADTATKDVYPGDTPANGDLKFTDRLFNGDVLQMITWG